MCSRTTSALCREKNAEVIPISLSFFGTFKGECVERACFQTRGQVRQTIFEYVECFYNRVRRHSPLSYASPVVYEQLMGEPECFESPQKRVNLTYVTSFFYRAEKGSRCMADALCFIREQSKGNGPRHCLDAGMHT